MATYIVKIGCDYIGDSRNIVHSQADALRFQDLQTEQPMSIVYCRSDDPDINVSANRMSAKEWASGHATSFGKMATRVVKLVGRT